MYKVRLLLLKIASYFGHLRKNCGPFRVSQIRARAAGFQKPISCSVSPTCSIQP